MFIFSPETVGNTQFLLCQIGAFSDALSLGKTYSNYFAIALPVRIKNGFVKTQDQ